MKEEEEDAEARYSVVLRPQKPNGADMGLSLHTFRIRLTDTDRLLIEPCLVWESWFVCKGKGSIKKHVHFA